MFDDNIRLKVLGKKADAQVSEVEANSPSFDQRSTGGYQPELANTSSIN